MAATSNPTCSAMITNSSVNSKVDDHSNQPNELLINREDTFYWKGEFDELKKFIDSILKSNGKWSSPGGEVKIFTNEDCVMKWSGKKRKKIAITSDNNNVLLDALQDNATRETEKQNKDDSTPTTTPNDEAAILTAAPDTNNSQSVVNSEILRKFEQLESKITELERCQQYSEETSTSRCAELEAKIEALLLDKNEMNSKLLAQQSTIDELTEDNTTLKQILDIKQKEWIQIENKNTPSNHATTRNTVSIETNNRFSPLHIEPEVEDHTNATPVNTAPHES